MVLTRWNPYNELRRMREEMDRIWRGQRFFPEEDEEIGRWSIPLDVVDENNNIVVHATVPGIKPEDIEVTLDDDVLTIRGQTETEKERKEGDYLMRERRTGAFHRMLRLPNTVDTERAEIMYDNGVLTISFPKIEAKKAKRLPIGGGKSEEQTQ